MLHHLEANWGIILGQLLQSCMVDGNVFVVRIIILQPQNGIQNTFAPYSAVSVSILYVNKGMEWMLGDITFALYPLSWTKGVVLGYYANRCYNLK